MIYSCLGVKDEVVGEMVHEETFKCNGCISIYHIGCGDDFPVVQIVHFSVCQYVYVHVHIMYMSLIPHYSYNKKLLTHNILSAFTLSLGSEHDV